MKPKDFVAGLRENVIDENISIYKNLFSNTSIEKVTDQYWKNVLALFQSLPSEQQAVFFELIRQTMIDTTSNILGILDGVSTLNGANDKFALTYGKSQETLTGDLQSLFLAEEETI
ncbi:hypothetical protein ACLBNB_02325 [Pseudomonas chlororaphis subsp. aurantiaca]|uniref:hypothetical protein n=1 Tax=Pseudomonas chlororaphis TaxID=587753 RepID=UPI00398B11F4